MRRLRRSGRKKKEDDAIKVKIENVGSFFASKR